MMSANALQRVSHRAWRGAMAAILSAMLVPTAHAQDDQGGDGQTQGGSDTGEMIVTHGYNYFGNLEYSPDFAHFDYVNPDAPKGGEISFGATGTFDSMNPFSRKGRAGALSTIMYESLLDVSDPQGGSVPADEYGSYYGLLAERMEYDEGKTEVTFHLRQDAEFSDGEPVTAQDVVFTHNLFLEQGLPSYAQAVSERITSAEALDDHTVRFTFKEGISRRSLIDQVGATPVFPEHWFEETGARLDESRMDIPPGSGPYMLGSVDVNRSITYERDPNYWGADLPINQGRHNFDRIRMEYFADDNAAFEGFKAGVYTFRIETDSQQWATGYNFPKVNQGYVVTEEIADGAPPTASGIVFNLGREILQDRQVRQAIALAYNFEFTNRTFQGGLFEQRDSFSEGTELEAAGEPTGAEAELLQTLGDVVPEDVMTSAVVTAHTSDERRLADRGNLRRASELLDAAGWTVGSDGRRRNADGEPLRLTFPMISSAPSTLKSVVQSFGENLDTIGVTLNYQEIDPAQYTQRTRDRDYDLVFDSYPSFMSAGTGLHQRFGSEDAEFSLFNPAGLASPFVDAAINAALDSGSQAEQDTALRVLDRALRHEFFMIPVWYKSDDWVAYYDMYRHPDDMPPYGLGVLDFWWYDAEAAERLREAGALR